MKSRKLLYWVIAYLALGWIGHTLTANLVVHPDAAKFLSKKEAIADVSPEIWLPMLHLHIVAACIALLCGIFGFSRSLLQSHPRRHRRVGQLYVLTVLISAFTAYYLSYFATGGAISIVGFVLNNTIWITATLLSVAKIRAGHREQHRAWMIRSYALSLANTTLTVCTFMSTTFFDVDYVTAYQASVWACGVVNLSVAELIIGGSRRNSAALQRGM